MDAKIAIIAITTKSSIRVKPRVRVNGDVFCIAASKNKVTDIGIMPRISRFETWVFDILFREK